MADLEKEKKLLIEQMIKSRILKTPKIIDAFEKISRHEFVTKEYVNSSYMDFALPTLRESTISQPSTVAIMTEALDPREGEKILEIGTGSGWQTSLLAYIIGNKGKVVSIEFDPDLVEFAKKNIHRLGIKNVEVILGDGSLGHKKEAPYDKIIFTCATPSIPKPIKEQLRMGGRIVAPVGSIEVQRMLTIDRVGKDEFAESEVEPVSFVFVGLKGKYGYKEK
jgi:protein-L-isoaspartate(D-aspartate) O-methyltransferase